jgi:glycosyltransferase involved in cell wall biosynthesis
MRINFLVNEVNGGWEPTDTRLGGTEESVVRWAEDLTDKGHHVLVFRNTPLDIVINGVGYKPREFYQHWPDKADICINIKSSEMPPKEPTLYLTNETNASDLDLSKYLGVIWPSKWCVDNIPVNNSNTFILPHGFDDTQIYPGKKISKQCFYASSPDRGLETLLDVWPKVYEAHPDASLIVTYGSTANLPGVINLGECDEETMNVIYRTSDVWCHPCNGGELFCITGIKAQAAQCVPVIIPTMALAETVRHGFFTTKEEYANTLIKALDKSGLRDHVREKLAKEHYDNWSDSTDKLMNIIEKVI